MVSTDPGHAAEDGWNEIQKGISSFVRYRDA
jgi:hypothetical protein